VREFRLGLVKRIVCLVALGDDAFELLYLHRKRVAGLAQ
jgi:hypothetical protein